MAKGSPVVLLMYTGAICLAQTEGSFSMGSDNCCL